MNPATLNQLTPHVYWLPPDETTDRPILGVVTGERGSLLVDAGNSPAHANLRLNEIARLRLTAPHYLTLTHWHWDHVFGTAAIQLPTLAHIETKRIVTEMAHLDWSDEALDQRVAAGQEIEFCRDMIKAELPDRRGLVIRPPEIGFTAEVELDLGGTTAHLIHVGGDHAADSIIVYVPGDRLVFLSDCLGPDLYHQPQRYTAAGSAAMLDRLLSYEAEIYLTGHGDRPLARAEVVAFADLLRTVGRVVTGHEKNRPAILTQLEQTLPAPLDEDVPEIVNAFLAGLQ